jgi:hypothetical protein
MLELKDETVIALPSVVVSRQLLEQLGAFDEEWWAELKPLVPRALSAFYRHARSGSHQSRIPPGVQVISP